MGLPEIRLLQSAIALAEELNFSRAAQRLLIEQPALSKRIVELESRIDLRLFERNQQRVELTDAGRSFVEDARSAVHHTERAVAGARAAAQGTEEVLHIGRSVYADPHLVAAIQLIRLPLFPRFKIKLWSNFSHELARMVTLGRLDAALVIAIPDTPRLSLLSVAEASTYIALPKGSGTIGRNELSLEGLRGRDWIVPAPHVNPYYCERIQALASKKEILVPEMHTFTTAEEAKGLVTMYEGAAFLTREAALRISGDEISVLPLAEEQLRLETKLAMRSDNRKRLTAEFVRAVGRKLAHLRNSQSENFL